MLRRNLRFAGLVVCLLAAIAVAQDPARSDNNKAIARRYFADILNERSAAAIDAIVAADVVFRNLPILIEGIADFQTLAQARQMGPVPGP